MASLEDLLYLTRPSAGDPEGAVLLLHGRGADERDLYPLFDLIDPDRRLIGITPRAPLMLPPGGAHWYVSREVGYPDPPTFRDSFALLEGWLDLFVAEHGFGLGKVIIGGFSQGAVMAYPLALGAGRPEPAGLMAFSGFLPDVPDFTLDLGDREGFRVALGHGVLDPVIGVEFSRRARELLEDAGCDITYKESQMAHTIDPSYLEALVEWVELTLSD